MGCMILIRQLVVHAWRNALEFLTIVSAVTLHFGLIAGLFGMNVGGLPAKQDPHSFIIVIVVMLFIGAVELLYFYRKGWLE